MEEMKNNTEKDCNHSSDTECQCICHQPYQLILHTHACCSPCFKCTFKVKCKCKECSGAFKTSSNSSEYKLIIPSFHQKDDINQSYEQLSFSQKKIIENIRDQAIQDEFDDLDKIVKIQNNIKEKL